jgi:hypothetical protein
VTAGFATDGMGGKSWHGLSDQTACLRLIPTSVALAACLSAAHATGSSPLPANMHSRGALYSTNAVRKLQGMLCARGGT